MLYARPLCWTHLRSLAHETYNCLAVTWHQNILFIMDVKQQNNINNKQYQNTGLKPGIWCIEDRTSVWQLPDIKTLKWSKVSGAWKVVQLSGSWMTSKPWRESQAFGSWKIVQLSNSSQTSKPWREIRFLVHGRSYNSLTANWHKTLA